MFKGIQSIPVIFLILFFQNLIFFKWIQDCVWSIVAQVIIPDKDIIRSKYSRFKYWIYLYGIVTVVSNLGFVIITSIVFIFLGMTEPTILINLTSDDHLYRLIFLIVNLLNACVTALACYLFQSKNGIRKEIILVNSILLGVLSQYWINIVFPVSSFF